MDLSQCIPQLALDHLTNNSGLHLQSANVLLSFSYQSMWVVERGHLE